MAVVVFGVFWFGCGLWYVMQRIILTDEFYGCALKGKSLDVAMAVSIGLSLSVMVPLIYFHNVEGSCSPLWLVLFYTGFGSMTYLVGKTAKWLGY